MTELRQRNTIALGSMITISLLNYNIILRSITIIYDENVNVFNWRSVFDATSGLKRKSVKKRKPLCEKIEILDFR